MLELCLSVCLGAELTTAPASPYQGRPIYPNSARDMQSYASAMPIATSASYVVAPGKVIQSKPCHYLLCLWSKKITDFI